MQHPAYRRAQLLSEQQRPREAIAELQRALRAAEEGLRWDPTHTVCLNVRARVLAQQGRAVRPEGSRHAERVDWLLLGNLLGCAVVAFARPRRCRVRAR